MKILSVITYIVACIPYAVMIIYRKQIIQGLKETAKLLFTTDWEEE